MAVDLIRPARPGDAAAIARVHVESWRTTYPGQLPDQYLVKLSAETYARRWQSLLGAAERGRRTFVLETAADGVAGFASCGSQRTGLSGFDGEFYALYLLDQMQGLGWGRRLLGAMAQQLLDTGMQAAVVWVLRDNQARWFYERLGGQRLAEQPIHFAGARLTEVAYGWSDLVPLARLAADPPVGGDH
ncbi:GNAT family N-acetyltransferase [Oleisolibacter albus]|uniref:GNAT family N-acetyltransferase n=1 Tax=Oleisolibacter albus TaxID=2171757 RepID=UPI000DF43432|nr:GNAT family N-acetyltransferase [Oleisolibacter albus]